MPRRKPGTLLPIETEILEGALALQRSGHRDFHGFGLAQALRQADRSRALTSHGTLYKALARLEQQGLLTSSWEDAAAVEGRPRRRLYELTGDGVLAAERGATPAERAPRKPARGPGLARRPGLSGGAS
jgi:DNA-binding PadR family transcriptional regulator